MLMRRLASVVVVLVASSAAFGRQLFYEEVLDLLPGDRWEFRCPGWVSGEGQVGLGSVLNKV